MRDLVSGSFGVQDCRLRARVRSKLLYGRYPRVCSIRLIQKKVQMCLAGMVECIGKAMLRSRCTPGPRVKPGPEFVSLKPSTCICICFVYFIFWVVIQVKAGRSRSTEVVM